MKTNITLLAYFYRDVAGGLRSVRLTSEWRPKVSESGARMIRAASPLPADFFSEHITSIAALVGKNSAGKSTIIEDICRVLTGKKTKASASCLVYSCNEGMFQLGVADFAVSVDGETLHIERTNSNKQMHACYYSSAIDPFGRHGELVKNDGAIEFTDISSQTVFTTDLLEDDFIHKILYLRQVLDAKLNTLELGSENGKPRSIKFVCSLAYDAEESARAVVGMILSSLPKHDPRRADFIDEMIGQNVADRDDVEDLGATLPPLRKNGRFVLPGRGFYEFLEWYVHKSQGGAKVVEQPGTFRLIVGALADAAKWESEKRFEEIAAIFSTALDDLDGCVEQMLGPAVLQTADRLFAFLQLPFLGVAPLADDCTEFEIEITGSRSADDESYLRFILHLLMDLRQRSVKWSFHFSGISEGQKTLLTFFSRLYVALRRAREKGHAVILIDEHETGLHPEWQRRYLKELIDFIERENVHPTTFQVLLSTHSPFVVSDLPAQLVNIVEATSDSRQETFAANLLDLLLSPVFMEKSTGEFAASKIRDILAGIANAQTPEDLRKWRAATRVIADKMTKNFCNQKIEEREARFSRDHD